jgi:mRNA turnover protein 4
MARNKRNRVVTLTKVKPKGSQAKEKLMVQIREAAAHYRHVITFAVSNMRNNNFKDLRQALPDTRIFMGKCKIMSMALGIDEESECRDGIHLITNYLKGAAVGLLFTNHDSDKILNVLQGYEASNYARGGFVATTDFSLAEGILEDQPFSMETQLRKLGLPTKLDNGKVYLEQDTMVCKEGQVLTPEQCTILEIFGVEMAIMRIHVKAHLDLEKGEFQEYQELDLTAGGGGGDGDDDEDYEDEEAEMNDE